RRAARKAARCVGKTELRQDRRVNPVGEIAELVDRLVELSLGLGEDALQRGSRRLSRVQAEPDGEREQALLRTVVEVALHPPAFCLGGCEGTLFECPHLS